MAGDVHAGPPGRPPLVAAPDVTIESCFGGRLGQKLIDTGARAIWPCDDVYGTSVRELVNGLVGTHSVSVGDPGWVPEYGCAFGFNGVSHYFVVEHDAS